MAFSLARAARVVPARVAAAHVRNFNIHEYQGKILCDNYGVKVQKWRAAETAEEAKKGADELAAAEAAKQAAAEKQARLDAEFEAEFAAELQAEIDAEKGVN